MRGSVMKRGSTWTYVISLGHDEHGKRKQKWVGGHRTRKEAEDASREAERKVQEAQDETAKLADELKAIKEIPPPKPKKFKVRRNKRGDMDEVHEESSGRKFKVKRDADGNMVGIEEGG